MFSKKIKPGRSPVSSSSDDDDIKSEQQNVIVMQAQDEELTVVDDTSVMGADCNEEQNFSTEVRTRLQKQHNHEYADSEAEIVSKKKKLRVSVQASRESIKIVSHHNHHQLAQKSNNLQQHRSRDKYRNSEVSSHNFQIMQNQQSIFAADDKPQHHHKLIDQQNEKNSLTRIQNTNDMIGEIQISDIDADSSSRKGSQIFKNGSQEINIYCAEVSDISNSMSNLSSRKDNFIEQKLLPSIVGAYEKRTQANQSKVLRKSQTLKQAKRKAGEQSLTANNLSKLSINVKQPNGKPRRPNFQRNQSEPAQIAGTNKVLKNNYQRKKMQEIKQKAIDESIISSQGAAGRSMSGFEMGQQKSQSSFFASLRQQQTHKEMTGFIDTSKLTGKKFIEQTIKQSQNRYEKKFAFEKGSYHQCIPNPRNPKQRITVQLLDRAIFENQQCSARQSVMAEVFQNDQNMSQSISQTYDRFSLVSRKEKLEQELDHGEGEGKDENGDLMSQSSSMQQLISQRNQQRNSIENIFDAQSAQHQPYGKVKAMLYTPKTLFRDVSKLLGIQSQHYADIAVNNVGRSEPMARKDSSELAVIAFWDLTDLGTFKCNRFFLVPDPHKRLIKDSVGTCVYKVLYTSEHTGDVFFFFKGQQITQQGDDLTSLHDTNHDDPEYSIGFLKLSFTGEELFKIGENRQISKHCSSIQPISDTSVLRKHLQQLHEQSLDEQDQIPDFTIIQKPMKLDDEGHLLCQIGKLVVFTAFLLQDKPDSNFGNSHFEGKIFQSWYPTIFFYDLGQQLTIWEIYGAEQFITANKNNIYFLTNCVWLKVNEEFDYKQRKKDDPDFTRHEDYHSYIKKMKFGQQAVLSESFEQLQYEAPIQPACFEYRTIFDHHSNLEKTDAFKIVAAHMHADRQRVTLLYQGFGSFTFVLKRACSLTQKSLWKGKYQEQNLNCHLIFSVKDQKIIGEGHDDYEQKIIVEAQLRPSNEEIWEGFIESNDLHQDLMFDLKFSKQGSKNIVVTANWKDDDNYSSSLSGNLGSKNLQSGQQKIIFTLQTSICGRQVYGQFQGSINLLRTKISGRFEEFSQEKGEAQTFQMELSLSKPVPGTMHLKIGDNGPIEKEILVDYQQKTIKSAEGHEQDLELTAIEAVDQAELLYSILREDVSFLRSEGKAYIQARFTAADETEFNGDGVTETSAILYCVDAIQKKDKDNAIKKLAGEPKERFNVRFFLNQSFLRANKKDEIQMWHVEPSQISVADGKQRIFGSVLYEEHGSNEVRLNMWSAYVESDVEQKVLDYFQEPVPQSWIIDYPLLAYKTFTPRNKEIAIVHLAKNMPQKIIHLGQWEFVCFVNHTQMVEQKCFKRSKETNCDIMMLVKRTESNKDGSESFQKCRLLSFKSNPWLHHDEQAPEKGDTDICKQSFYIFSGDIGVIPTEDWAGNKIDQNRENHIMLSQRYNNDKIQTCQLITKTIGTYEQFMLIIQFNDCIVQASLNRKFFKPICLPTQMKRRHMVRGYNEKVFYAETSGKVDKIFQIEFHPTKHNEINRKEIFQLAAGWLVAFEPDGECIQNDIEDEVTQSFFVMDDLQKIYLLVKNQDNVRFHAKKVIDFSWHKKAQMINDLRETDWAHVHITERALTMGGTTYNLNTMLQYEQNIPKSYYGKSHFSTSFEKVSEFFSESDSSNDDSDSSTEDEDHDSWQVQTQQGMAMTTNMVLVAQRNQREFCFLLKPAPGSRKISFVGFQQLHEIEQMLFVSNQHILVKFRGGKSVTLLSNGSIIQQEARVQELLESSERVIGQSQIYRGKKYVLFEDQYGDENQFVRYVALQFESNGQAKCVGIFEDFKKQIRQQVSKRKKMIMLKHNITEDPVDRQKEFEVAKAALDIVNIKIKQFSFGRIPTTQSSKRLSLAQNKIKFNEVRFAREYFITEKGEVIKMAAIVTHDPIVKQKLRQLTEAYDRKVRARRKSGDIKEHFISIYKVHNNHDPNRSLSLAFDCANAFTVIIFHALDAGTQTQYVENTQYCVVGNYLCHRTKNKQFLWVTKLKENNDDLIQHNRLGNAENFHQEYKSVCLSIDKMTKKVYVPHIQLTEVPKAYFSTIKSRNKYNQMEYYDNLLQVTISTNGMIFDLDSDPIKEVDAIENIDQLQKPDCCVNTGFIMSVSNNHVDDKVSHKQRTQIITNEYCNLLFQKTQLRAGDKTATEKRQTRFLGMLYRSFSSIDLQELAQIQQAVENRNKISYIDPESLLCSYEGNTIFSIFFDRIQVYEKLLEQLKDKDWPGEEDINGQDAENSFLRRLYRTMVQPTEDLHHYKQLYDSEFVKRSTVIRNKKIKTNNCLATKSNSCFKMMCQGQDNYKKNIRLGFKSILKKSLYFSQARFRECLMELAMLCDENSINDFVDNLEDIKILFVSMSPAIVAQFENAFKRTKFTQAVQNADWRIGEKLEVIGQMSSIIMEKETNNQIKKNQKRFIQNQGEVQNRQVSARMLPIDWIFAPCNNQKQVGFAEFVVAISHAPHESLFSTDLIITLVDHFWDRYYKAVILKCFIPFLIYMISMIWYISVYGVKGHDKSDEFNEEMVLRFLILSLIIYFLYFEVRCMMRDKMIYLLDLYNYVDIGTFILNIYLIRNANQGTTSEAAKSEYLRPLASIAVLLMWAKSFYWLRLFGSTSFFVRLIADTLYDTRYFLILFMLILMTFGNAMLVLSTDREKPLYDDYIPVEVINVVLNQYIWMLGEFNADVFIPGHQGGDSVAWMLFVIATMITQIMFLNMLIGIMGDTFDRVTESRDQSALVEKIRILADYVYVVPRESIEKGTMSRFLFAIRPKALGTDESGGWTGTTSTLKKVIESQSSSLSQQINSRMNTMQASQQESHRKIEMLEERLSDLNGASQRQQGMIEQILKLLKENQPGASDNSISPKVQIQQI